jgi:DNA polymerase-4
MPTRIILHVDLDAFFCAVEEQLDPTLKGLPFAVGGQPNTRGVVASCSYAARAFGVHSAMPMSTAKRLCPELRILSHHFDAYRDMSSSVMAILHDITPFVEQISIDEAFLDVTGLHDTGRNLAYALQKRIRDELNLPCSLGVASNKLVAKIANDVGKKKHKGNTYPEAVEIVADGREAWYLAPLPVKALWGVGDKTAERLQAHGIRTIGDIAKADPKRLQAWFGKHGWDLWQRAQGIDHRKVETEHAIKSVSHETTFSRDESNGDTLRQTIRQLSEQVGRRLRQKQLHGTTIRIKLRWSDFTTITRQMTLKQATHQDDVITQSALALFEQAWQTNRPVRLIGVGVANLEEHGVQLDLWETKDNQKSRRLQDTLDELRDRFGNESMKRGSDL